MDAFIFAGGAATTIAIWDFVGPYALAIPYLLGHFFLFCNTFRVGGERSLIWVASFLANAYFWTQTQNLVMPLLLQELVTLALIVQCVLGRNYHGIACKQLNPDRYRDGAMSEGAFTRKVLLACHIPEPLIESLVGRRLDEFKQEP